MKLKIILIMFAFVIFGSSQLFSGKCLSKEEVKQRDKKLKKPNFDHKERLSSRRAKHSWKNKLKKFYKSCKGKKGEKKM